MVIDCSLWRALVTALVAVCLAGPVFAAPVKDGVFDRVGVLDARRPDGLASLVTSARTPSGTWRFVRLPSVSATRIECCVEAGGPTESSVLQLSGDEVAPTVAQGAIFEPVLKQGFIGLAVRGDLRIRVVSAHRLVLSWPNRERRLQVDHCLSAEGMHVWLRRGDRRLAGRPLHYYFPLGVDVTPNCSSSMLADGAGGSRR